jgi:uncharacterized protein (TIGR02265 family)
MDTRESLQRRMALARPEDMALGMFFSRTLAGANDLFGVRVAEAASAAVSAKKWEAFFKYPVVDLLRLNAAVAEAAERWRGMAYAQAVEQLGGLLGVNVLEAPFGKALRQLAAGDAHRVLAGSMSSAKASTTFGERAYEKLGPQSARLTFHNELMGPSWTRGLYAKVLSMAAAMPQMTVTLEKHRAPGIEFSLRCDW